VKIQTFTQLELQTLGGINNRLVQPKDQILDEIGVYMVASITLTFEEQGRPKKWKENAPATLKQKTGNMILHEAGPLKAGTTHRVEGNAVYIGPSGTAIVYARIQHLGGEAGPGHAVTIPARPIYVVQDEDNVWIVQTIRSYVMGH
jgi:phage virion morphogenesis protein